MKKFLAVLFIFVSAFVLIACGDSSSSDKIVLITDKGAITDKSFNEGAFNGVKAFGEEHKIEYAYIKPADATTDDYIAAIDQAVEDGATVIVTPGYLFEEAIGVSQETYPKVKFIILDAAPEVLKNNTHGVFYAEEQAGFLAGYAAVKDGFRKLGFMGGMAVPAVQRFGHGFVQGVAKAAAELELAENAVTIDYLYTGDFVASPEVQAAAATMFNSGAEVIFACGGAVGVSVMAAAEAEGKKVIGVDVDQSGESTTVITSAMKGLAESVILALESIFVNNTWDKDFGGKVVTLAADNNGIGLPMDKSKFTSFDEAAYNAVYAKLVDGTIEVSNVIGEFGDSGNAAKQFETALVKVTVIPFG